MRICSIYDCGKVVKSRGFCANHYARWRRNGDPLVDMRPPRIDHSKPCSYCGSTGKIVAKGLCAACYQRNWKSGALSYKFTPEKCSVSECDSFTVAKGYCEKHYRRVQAHGNPHLPRGSRVKEKHPLYLKWREAKRHRSGVCAEWVDFWAFVDAMGEYPQGFRLTRPDQDAPLSPTNYLWREVEISCVDAQLESRAKVYQRRRRIINKKEQKSAHLKKCFGITVEEYQEMFEAQGGVCAICGNPEQNKILGKTISLAVDHCHSGGGVRGLLCHKCNAAIGLLRESESILKNAIAYLRNATAPVVE